VQLRELVARLAAAEAQRHGNSPLCVTWGEVRRPPTAGWTYVSSSWPLLVTADLRFHEQ
jgi:hypothetical protein